MPEEKARQATAQDDCADAVATLKLVEQTHQLFDHEGVDRVQAFGPVQNDVGDARLAFQLDRSPSRSAPSGRACQLARPRALGPLEQDRIRSHRNNPI
jgi:hypothetical protein